MNAYVHGRIKGNTTVHLFHQTEVAGVVAQSEPGLAQVSIRVSRTPICGSGNTHNINHRMLKKVVLTGDEVTCKKCRVALYGGNNT